MDKGIFYLIFLGLILRLGFFSYGIYQDLHFEVKYTDIDYFVFNDAAGYVFEDASPYLRDTYRYTPLLSWLLLPNFYSQWIHFGKILFVLFDLLTGIIITKILKTWCSGSRLLILSSIWLLNPMVITISTRGNAESVLCFLIMCSLYYLQKEKFIISGLLFGLSIHFKIYPIIHALPISVYIFQGYQKRGWFYKLVKIGYSAIIGLLVPTYLMHQLYGFEYLEHAYFYHFSRTDHRHNFSVWNLLLLLNSAEIKSFNGIDFAKFAFIPQLLVCTMVVYLQTRNPSFQSMLDVLFLQTFSFVTYNKVCTSQYFIWYLVLLPSFLSNTVLTVKEGIKYIVIWILSQAIWLSQAYLLEFKGMNVFFPNLFIGNLVFFMGNIYILSVFISDVKKRKIISVAKKYK